MAKFFDRTGAIHELPLAVTMYRLAADNRMSMEQYLNATYGKDVNAEKDGTVFQQALASEGIYLKANRELGIRPSTLAEVLNGPTPQAGTIVRDGVPTSRILFPAVIMAAIEDKLVANLSIYANAFDQLVGYDETINGDRYEFPVLNFSKPEAARSQGVSQLSDVPSMLSITASDVARRIPNFAIGLEISDQALKISSLDLVAMALARQAAVERNERAQNYVLQLWNGDVDNNDGTLASKGLVDASSTFDAAATGGTLTHKAWIKFLMKNGTKRTLTHLVTDFDTAYKIETRAGKPVITNDDSQTSRIDTQFGIMNPSWAKNPQVFLCDLAGWPAGTIMGLDKAWAVRRVRNLGADYQAIESYVMRRSQAMRIDFGEHVTRMFDDAYAGMTLS